MISVNAGLERLSGPPPVPVVNLFAMLTLRAEARCARISQGLGPATWPSTERISALRGIRMSVKLPLRGSQLMKLHVIIEKDESGYYVAEVPALPGCLSQGNTSKEAEANIKEAIVGWLAVMDAKTQKQKRGGRTLEVSV